MPSCRICHVPINKDKEVEGIDWVMPSKNYYYHKSCYDTWKAQPMTEKDWVALIYDFLARDLKVSYNYHLCEAQIKKFWKENKINPKGIYFTLNYFYEINSLYKDLIFLLLNTMEEIIVDFKNKKILIQFKKK